MKSKKEYLNVDGGKLYYEVAGKGMPLVLSHAAFLDSRMFDEIWEPLAKHFCVIRYDMRGFGRSSPVTSPLCRRNDLDQLLNHLDITQAHLVGCSLSGEVSLDLTLEQPQRVASLTLVGSTPSGFELHGEPPRHLLEMFGAMQSGNIDHANELQIRIWLDGGYREPNQVNSKLRKKALEMNHIPVSQSTFFIADTQPVQPLDPSAITRLGSVQCPTLIVAGSFDHSEILRAANEMAEKIPNARKAIMDGCGHVPSYEQPEIFAETLLNFLNFVQ